jgi:hypothetical protein
VHANARQNNAQPKSSRNKGQNIVNEFTPSNTHKGEEFLVLSGASPVEMPANLSKARVVALESTSDDDDDSEPSKEVGEAAGTEGPMTKMVA